MTNRARLHFAAIVAALTLVASAASAQDMRGTVSDSSSRIPIAGAVITAFDSAGATLSRSVSNAKGEFRLPLATQSRRIRVVRMGFRPRDVRLTATTGATLDVRMVVIPTMLERVDVTDNGICPRRNDRAAALALLEQARAGLLNSVVSREAHPAAMTILPYERQMQGNSERIARQTVKVKMGERVSTSFYAVRTAKEFVREGFVKDSVDTRVYYGPDENVLLDEGFTSGYCFHLAGKERARPNQLGLAFVPASRRRNRIDIEGTLWVDTLTRKLVDLQYKFLGLPFATDPVMPGGSASYWELPNGIVFIDKWHFRLPVPEYDTTYSPANNNVPKVHLWYSTREAGGEVASGVWPDTQAYQGSLGILNAQAVNPQGKPVTGVVVRLKETDYVASPDSSGFFAIADLLPGPYEAIVIDPTLADLEVTLPTSLKFTAVRDSVVQEKMVVPDPLEIVKRPCNKGKSPPDIFDSALGGRGASLSWRILTPDGKGVKGARWLLTKVSGKPWPGVVEAGTTDDVGGVRPCMLLSEGDVIEMQAWRDGIPSRAYRRTIPKKGLAFTITLLPPLSAPPF